MRISIYFAPNCLFHERARVTFWVTWTTRLFRTMTKAVPQGVLTHNTGRNGKSSSTSDLFSVCYLTPGGFCQYALPSTPCSCPAPRRILPVCKIYFGGTYSYFNSIIQVQVKLPCGNHPIHKGYHKTKLHLPVTCCTTNQSPISIV
jgi:hypothetical protein